MTSSSSFEIAVLRNGERVLSLVRDPLETPDDAALEIDAKDRLSIVVRRGDPSGRVRVRLGGEQLALAHPGVEELRTPPEPWFVNEYGECLLVVEADFGAEGDFGALFRMLFHVRARPEVARDYRVMVEELERVHVALATDVLGRMRAPLGLSGARPLHAPELVDELERAERRLGAALAAIARQPSAALTRERRVSRWRPGDRADGRVVRALALAGVRPPAAGGAAAAAGAMPAVRVARPVPTTDIPEHRHIAEGLRVLARRAERVADGCREAAASYRAAEARWGRRGAEGRSSVYEERDLPRAVAMDELAARADRLAGAFASLRKDAPFLAGAGTPRTPFGPTPLFLNRPAYREAYEALRDASGPLGVLVDTGPVTTSLRNLATLFEYWCYLRVVESVRRRFGPPSGAEMPAEVYDDIYRPDLRPGQRVEFEGGALGRVVVGYEWDFPPAREARRSGARFAASLTGAPLRPDIVVEVTKNGQSRLLLLDAKSTDNFTTDRLRDVVDYLIQIHETGAGRQPARQLFLLHRDAEAGVVCSLPGYLSGRVPGTAALVKGALPVVPARVDVELPELDNVLERFFESARAESRP